MTDARSKRDLIWEEKRRKREERLMGDQQEPMQQPISQPSYTREELFNPVQPEPVYQQPPQTFYQPPPQEYRQPAFEPRIEQRPPMQQMEQRRPEPQDAYMRQPAPSNHQDSFMPGNDDQQQKIQQKQQKNQYGEFLRQQMQEKEQAKLQGRKNQSHSIENARMDPVMIKQQAAKNDYADFLKQQMMEKEMMKQQHQQRGYQPPVQQYGQPPVQQYGQPQMEQQYSDHEAISKKMQKQEYGDYLKQQMAIKQANKNVDKKEQLQMQMQQRNGLGIGENRTIPSGRRPPVAQQPQYQEPVYQPQQYMQPQQIDQYPQQQYDYQAPVGYQAQSLPQINSYPPNEMYSIQNQLPPARYPQEPPSYHQAPSRYEESYQDQQMGQPMGQPIQLPLDDNRGMRMGAQAPDDPRMKMGRNRLMMENANMDDVAKKERAKLEMQQALQQQMEEKARKKKEEEERRKQEERQEEERVRREQQEMERQVKEEEDKKKKQQQNFQQANLELKNDNNKRKNRNKPTELEFNHEQEIKPDVSKEFLMNEKLREGADERQSLVDFYKNGNQVQFDQQPQLQQQQMFQPQQPQFQMQQPYGMQGQMMGMQQPMGMGIQMQQPMGMQQMGMQQPMGMQPQGMMEIEMLKRQMVEQQQQLQDQIQQVMQQAQFAMENRNKAEMELNMLKNQAKDKYMAEEQNHKDLMLALVRNDPKWEKQVFPPHLVAQAQINEERDLGMPQLQDFDRGGHEQLLQPQRYQSQFAPLIEGKPAVFREEPVKQRQAFNEQFGMQSLVSDSNFVPIDILDKLQDQNIGLSKLNQYSVPNNRRPQSKQQMEYNHRLPQIEELNRQYEDSIGAGGMDLYNLEQQQYRQRPSSKREQWNVPSINSDITKEIDVLLNYKPSQFDTLKSNNNVPPRVGSARHRASSAQRPSSSAFSQAANNVLTHNQPAMTLDSQFPDITMNYGPPRPSKHPENARANGGTKQNGDTYNGDTYNGGTFKGGTYDTLDIAGINKKADQRLQQLNQGYNMDSQPDEDLDKLDRLLENYRG